MSNNKQSGLLPFYKSDQSQDWALSGYYNNWQSAVQYVPRDVLVSFMTPTISGTKTAPTEITIRKLSITGGIKTVLSSADYTVTLYEKQQDSQTQYYFIQSAISSNPTEYLQESCLYEIYLEDADGNGFISNIFIAFDETEIYIHSESGEIITDESGEGILFE